MTNQQHPITPPPELRRLWAEQARRMYSHDPVAWIEHVANQAAHWGADRELKACCEWVSQWCGRWPDGTRPEDELCDARRPKPPSLAEQAIEQLQAMEQAGALDCNIDAIRRALERLQELEKGNE